MININDYISELCMRYGTYIYNSIDINAYISYLCNIWNIYISYYGGYKWVKKKRKQ